MKVRTVMARLRAEGWLLVRQKGSHRPYKHPIFGRLVTLAGHENEDLHPGAEASVFKQTGWKKEN